jgi:hypothetical protein
MSPAQRAELRRRYVAFLRHFTSPAPAPRATRQPARLRKWIPGKSV